MSQTTKLLEEDVTIEFDVVVLIGQRAIDSRQL